jgi:hypothetical protein
VDIGFASRIREFAGMELENALWRFQAKWMPVRVKKTRQNKSWSPALIPSKPEYLRLRAGGFCVEERHGFVSSAIQRTVAHAARKRPVAACARGG